jgi:copper chaperone CopZ
VGNWGVVVAVCREESPGAVVEDVGVELATAVVQTQGGSVDTDDITEAGDNRQVLESLGVEDEGCVV